MRTSKIKSKQGNGTWNSDKYGMFYKWEIEMENGDVGNSLTKDEMGKAYEIGAEIDYEFTESEKGNRLKRISANGQPNRSSKGGNGKFALSYSKDLWVAGKLLNEDEYFDMAAKNLKWLNENA